MKMKEKLPKDFNFETFSQQAIERLKQGEELTGKEGILTPLDMLITSKKSSSNQWIILIFIRFTFFSSSSYMILPSQIIIGLFSSPI